MSDTVIEIEGLSKQYRLGVVGSGTLSHDLNRWWARLRGKADPTLAVTEANDRAHSGNSDFVWALKDINLEVKHGEILGIIGRNGAGKSTLLKILSRVTAPTKGSIKVKGRIASLLEVGTGFHQELTGRENIYLNGAILGMTRNEVTSKLDEIVVFSGCERFIDTPVKRYSSGMMVRLGFAVAAHLEPEILVVDEVLAVGDAEFQKKCLGKMQDVAGHGRTVLFVSHNMNSIETLCNRAVLFDEGQQVADSTAIREVIKGYMGSAIETAVAWKKTDDTFKNPYFEPTHFFIGDGDGELAQMPLHNDANDIWIYLAATVEMVDPALTVGYAIFSEDGNCLYWSYFTDSAQEDWPEIETGKLCLRSRIPEHFLNEGSYRIELIGGLNFRKWFFEPSKGTPTLSLTIRGGLSDSPLWMVKRQGLLAPVMNWERYDDI